MSLTKSTGWLAVQDGGTTNLPIDVAHIVSARLRWRGKDKRLTDSRGNSGGASASFPGVPEGWTRSGGEATHSATVQTGAAYDSGTVGVSAPGGSKSVSWSLSPHSSKRVTASANCSGTGTANGTWTKGQSATSIGSQSTSARVYYYKDIQSENLSAMVNAVLVTGPASLNNGQVSDWYPVSLAIGANTITHSITSSEQADIEIEYTYQPYCAAPTRHSPANQVVTDDETPTFEMTMPASDASTLHSRISLSMMATMSSPTVYDSSASQGGWEYLSGGSWLPLPVGGVAPGTKVRFTPPTPLPPGTWYWTVAAKDWAWGASSEMPWMIRRVLSVDALEGYALAVGATPWTCTDLTVTESSNGEISTIEFTVPNHPDDNGRTAHDLINYGDPVYVSIYDSTGEERQYLARVWEKQVDDLDLRVVATMGDKILADRLVTSDYLETDIGTALKSIIETDCAPLLSDGIPAPFGLTANLETKNRQAMQAFQEAFSTFGLLFWNETQALDWVQYLADPTTLSPQGIMLEFPMEEV
jgi:hypothetical protein